jgi:peptidoglycan/LPS O-acetylase OafA/YrhL
VSELAFLNGALRCIAGFFTGFLVYWQFIGTSQPVKHAATALEVAAVALVILSLATPGNLALTIIAPVAFALPLWVFAAQCGHLSTILTSKPIQNLGKWSYGIYLVHIPTIQLLNHWLAIAQTAVMKTYGSQCAVGYAHAKTASAAMCGLTDVAVLVVMTGIYFALVISFARLSYRYIEAPARRWFNARAETEYPKAFPDSLGLVSR